jgi:hypothetical protein
MVITMIVLGVLLILGFYGIIANTSTRLSFLEKEADVIDFIEVYDSDTPNLISGYKPVVRFEVDGKFYQGATHVYPLWRTKENKSLVILYNPQKPSEFQAKESSASPATGCAFIVIVITALVVTLFFYLRNN